MIFDKIENIINYNAKLSFIIDDLVVIAFKKGRSEIENEDKLVIGLEYQTTCPEKSLWENHRKYLDIHIILEGDEFIQVANISKMKRIKEYELDYELFEGEHQQSIHLETGYFLLLYPHEVHKTSIWSNGASSYVKKNVYKLILDEKNSFIN